jgi:hypothetical protein
MRLSIVSTIRKVLLVCAVTLGGQVLSSCSCEDAQKTLTVNLFLFEAGQAGGDAELENYKGMLTELIARDEINGLEQFKSLKINVYGGKGTTSIREVTLSPFDVQADYKQTLRLLLDTIMSKKVMQIASDQGAVVESIKGVLQTQRMLLEREDYDSSSTVFALVGRLPDCHNVAAELKNAGNIDAGEKGRTNLFWLVPGARMNDTELRNGLGKMFRLEMRPIRVPGYVDCPSELNTVAPKNEVHVVSFARSAEQARTLAREILKIDSTSRFCVFCDGVSGPIIVDQSTTAAKLDSLTTALFKGTVPQFSSINYLLTSSLLRWKSPATVPKGVRYIVAGNLPAPSMNANGKALLTTQQTLTLLPKSIELNFLRFTRPDPVGLALIESYKQLGYQTKVVSL